KALRLQTAQSLAHGRSADAKGSSDLLLGNAHRSAITAPYDSVSHHRVRAIDCLCHSSLSLSLCTIMVLNTTDCTRKRRLQAERRQLLRFTRYIAYDLSSWALA